MPGKRCQFEKFVGSPANSGQRSALVCGIAYATHMALDRNMRREVLEAGFDRFIFKGQFQVRLGIETLRSWMPSHRALRRSPRSCARASRRLRPAPGKGATSPLGLRRRSRWRAQPPTIRSPASCGSDSSPISLPPRYDAAAQSAASLQLERAGVRLASILNRARANVTVQAAAPGAPTTATTASGSAPSRTPESLACSAEADTRSLHGKDRQRFRRECILEHRAA